MVTNDFDNVEEAEADDSRQEVRVQLLAELQKTYHKMVL